MRVKTCIQEDSAGELSSEQSRKPSEPYKEFKDQQQKFRDFHAADIANQVTPDIDPDIDSDTKVMCMIFQASEESKQDFESFKRLTIQNGCSFEPIRRTKSTEPPATSRMKNKFSRARTMP
mmetsp:Transcript_18536/g.39119  ORF Transcript_18536/g.39119 Transcript_18536/m.39119 type:complete len:121 (-) Transcript_18536:32-394(-)